MQHALYDPEEGYYARSIRLGAPGDFSTSATLCPAFAEAIAHWVVAAAEELKWAPPYPLIELGPGDGSLAQALQTHLGGAVRLHLVETSAPFVKCQQERLGPACGTHFTTLRAALEASKGQGLIIANEFVDAFPAMQLCWSGGQWMEVAVQYTAEGAPEECLLPFQQAIDAEAPAQPQEGQRIFIHPSFHHWLAENIPALQQGACLLIDYGADYPARECRAYAGQERYEGLDIYRQAGHRDITCDVNFSDLRRWGEALGLRARFHGSQRDFLQRHLDDFVTRCQEDATLDFISRPLGAGEAFRVLEWVR